ncbi:MAG TPA: hypothetical protein VGW57_03665 [Chthoniobacterales bacterium]|nr:hypothetical protein [Chthoniobacterales bacterium]
MKSSIGTATFNFLLLLCLLFAGCGRRGAMTEVTAEQITVLESPVPLWYPSTNPQKNRVIGTLHRGDRFYLLGEDFGKDYKYFNVELLSGQKGYVIYEGGGPMFQTVEKKK